MNASYEALRRMGCVQRKLIARQSICDISGKSNGVVKNQMIKLEQKGYIKVTSRSPYTYECEVIK